MLALQIAAGIVLAAVVLRYWRQSLVIAGLLILLLTALVFAMASGMDLSYFGIMALAFLIIALFGDRIRRRFPRTREKPPTSQGPPS